MSDQHWQDWLITLVGAWLIASNWLLDYGVVAPDAGSTMQMVFWGTIAGGGLAMLLGIAALASFRLWEEWADVVLGLALVVSPWVLGFASLQLAVWNVVLSGVVIIVSAAWTILEVRDTSHAA